MSIYVYGVRGRISTRVGTIRYLEANSDEEALDKLGNMFTNVRGSQCGWIKADINNMTVWVEEMRMHELSTTKKPRRVPFVGKVQCITTTVVPTKFVRLHKKGQE